MLALYYSSLATMGGGERQWADELRAYWKAGVEAIGITHDAPSQALRELGLEDGVIALSAGNVVQRANSLRRWLRREGPALLVAHTSPELTYLATRGTGNPYVLYQNSPVFYGDFSKNPYPFAFQHAHVFKLYRTSTPGYQGFASSPMLGPVARSRLELRALLKARAVRHAARVVVVSNRTAREVNAVYGVQADVVRGSLDERLLEHRPHLDVRGRHRIGCGPLLVSIGRLDPVKRIDLLLKAIAKLQPLVPDVRLLIGGVGPEEASLKDLARSLAVVDNVTFLGYVPESEVWDYYASADVFVSPATADFILTPYEALALGRKVVISEDLEFEDWLLGRGCVFQSSSNPDNLASTIREALAAPIPEPPDLSPLYADARVRTLLQLFESIPGWNDHGNRGLSSRYVSLS